MTATPKRLKDAVDARDGHTCSWCGIHCHAGTLVPQHRANRGSGGRKSAMVIENLLWLCPRINGLIESDWKWANEARARGIKVSTFLDPAQVPVWMFEGWWLLNPDGTKTRLRVDEAAELRVLHGMEA